MWSAFVFLGGRYVIGGAVGVVAVTSAISAISVYGRERQLDGETIAIAVVSMLVAGGLWPDDEYLKGLKELYKSQRGKPPFLLLPTLGATLAGLLAVGLVAGFVLLAQRDSTAQMEAELLATRAELSSERTAVVFLSAHLCEEAEDQIQCQLSVQREARAWVANQDAG